MKKPVIGILSTLKINNETHPYDNYYKIINLYSDRITEAGGLPVGILSIKCDKDLDIYDGFVFTGGTRVTEEHYKVIYHAIKNHKPLLGICLGMQALAIYDMLSDGDIHGDLSLILNRYPSLKKENQELLKKVENEELHGGKLVTEEIEASEENIKNQTHSIMVSKNSILYEIYKRDTLDVISMHRYAVRENFKSLTITAKSSDNIIEALELNEKDQFIIGVQFHIELEQNNLLFKKLVEKAQQDIKIYDIV